MERKSFNEVLRQRELREKAERAQRMEKDEGHIALDDSQRVKVLSPGRLVFKRFIRNRLAIVGSAILIFMFLFSFVGALIYPYDQTEKFHKFDYLFSPYANAQHRIELSNYIVDEEGVDTKANRLVNSMVKELTENGAATGIIFGDNNSVFFLYKVNDSVYDLKAAEQKQAATYTASILIGDYSMFTGISYAPDTQAMGSDFEAALTEAVQSGTYKFTYGESEYEIRDYSKKSGGKIYTAGDGAFTYSGTELGAAFEKGCAEAIEAKLKAFTLNDVAYVITEENKLYTINECIPGDTVLISTNYAINANTTGDPLATDKQFITAALLSLSEATPFEYNGQTYSVDTTGERPRIFTADGELFGEFSTFVVKDPAGKDVFNLEFKEAIELHAAELEQKLADSIATQESAENTESEPAEATEASAGAVDEARALRVMVSIPAKEVVNEERISTMLDENGEVVYAETELVIEKKVNDYVISCDQLSYLIDIYSPSSAEHIFGTDGDGYDVLSRMMHGGQISLLVGFVVVILEIILGTIMGGIAGYFGGWVDNIIMRLVDIFYCIPSMPILIIMGAFMDAAKVDPYVRLMYLMAILGFLGWAGVARLVRGQILSLREQEFMVATEATGVKVSRRIFRHLIPNVMPQLIVTATASLGGVIITESTLSFLGLGVKHPLATWGTMINSVTKKNEDILHYVYIWVPVGLLICLTVIAFNFVGDGLRDAFDPKMKK